MCVREDVCAECQFLSVRLGRAVGRSYGILYTVKEALLPMQSQVFRLGRFYFPRAPPRPWTGFEIKRQPESDCLSLHDHDSACRFLFFVHVHLGCIAFIRTVFSRLFSRSHVGFVYCNTYTHAQAALYAA